MAGEITQEIMGNVAGRMGDPAYDRFTESEILSYINAGFREIVDLCVDRALWQLTYVDETELVAATSTYDLPSDMARPTLLLYKTIPAVLWPHHQLRFLKKPNANADASETAPYWTIWNDDIELFVGSGGVTQDNGDTIELWYIKEPTTVSESVDPELGVWFYNAVETYACSMCWAQGQGDPDQSRRELMHFYAELQRINAHYTAEVPPMDGLPRDPSLAYLFGQAEG